MIRINRCATQHSKEYVLRDEIKETETGFILPFRAFRFKQGDAVKIECEVRYCEKCKKVRIFESLDSASRLDHAKSDFFIF